MAATIWTYRVMLPVANTAKNLVPCPLEWLPKADAHLAQALEAEVEAPEAPKKRKRVWFPVDETGNPHDDNPDDGFGGAIHKLETVHYLYATSDGLPPNEDHTNVLEGSTAHKKHRKDRQCADFNETANIMRELQTMMNISAVGRNAIWDWFELRVNKLSQPDWAYMGLAWRMLFNGAPRREEAMFD